MWVSGRASPGGSIALRTRCTRRSEEVTVPSYSHQSAQLGQHDVGQLRRRGAEDVLDDEVVEPGEELAGVRDVGLGLGGVLPDDVHRADLVALHGLEHLREVQALVRRDRRAPDALEAGALDVVVQVVAAGQLVGDGAHVATALHVVLPAQRHQARAPAPDVPGEQREVDQGTDVVDGVVVLGDAERPAQLGAVGGGVGERRVADQARVDGGDLLRPAGASTARRRPRTPRSPSSRAR